MLDFSDRAWPALLDRVCSENLLSPVFQPIVDVSRGVVCGYEGLARIDLPTETNGGPQEWFSAAALHGYSERLEAVALRSMLTRRRELPSNCFLSVNLSPDALMSTEIQLLLGDAGDLAGLVIEITEQTPVEDYETLTDALDILRGRGGMIAVDDTGAGYASLSHLLALRPQFVKLDRSLVTGLDHDPRRAAAVSAIGAFAGALDAWLVAEGVEHPAELERLVDLDVPLVQGYFLGRPDRQMQQIPHATSQDLQARHYRRNAGSLITLARPAPTVDAAPHFVAETTVLIDQQGRPRHVFVPAGGRRANRHAAMTVQPDDDVREIALRAAARQSEDRYGPLCLCDELGRLTGVISIESLLETLARPVTAKVQPAWSR